MGMSAIALSGLVGCSAGGTHTESSDALPERVTVAPTSENVRPIGRTCVQSGVTWLPHSGSGIEFSVVGTRVTLELAGDDSVRGEQDHRPRFAVLLDGEVIADDIMSDSERTVEVFAGDSARAAVVEVMHLSEAEFGAMGVKSIVVESDKTEPVSPTKPKGLSIEFVGDSITCAYGVEGSDPDEPFSTATENFMKSYAYLAAQELDADYSAVCYSGYGIVSGWSADGERVTDMLYPPLYDVVALGYEQPWDFSARSNDVVVINLGTNDSTYTRFDGQRMDEFARGYVELLAHVHELNPDSYLVCTLGTMGGLRLYPYVEQAVAEFSAATGYTRITCYATQMLDLERDGSGVAGHPNERIQRRDADTLVDVLRTALELEE